MPAAESNTLTAQPPEIPVFLKCACAHCGHVIEYIAQKSGKIVDCPKCRQKSQLPESEKMGIVELQGPPAPTTKVCPVCGTTRKFSEHNCSHCEAHQRRKKITVWTVASLLVISVTGGAWFAVHQHNVRLQAELAAEKASQPVVSVLPQPMVATRRSANDLQPGRFSLEQNRGSDLVMAVGDIVNYSGNVHHGLKVDLDLLDASGAKIGSVTDDSAELGPRQSWHVVIPVTNLKAKSVKFGSIKENQ